MMKLFLSYRRADSEWQSGQLHDLLVKYFGPANVFFDVAGSIPIGIEFPDVIVRAVEQATVVLAVIGEKWLTISDHQGRRLDNPHDFVRREIATALKRNCPVVPLLVGRTVMPPADLLPDEIKHLAVLEGMALRPSPQFDDDVRTLIRRLHERPATGAGLGAPVTTSPVDLTADVALLQYLSRQGGAAALLHQFARAHLPVWKRSSDKGRAPGQYLYGRCLEEGLGVPANPGEAARLYRLAADQGLPAARCALGDIFARGGAVPRNLESAFKWYQAAAELEDVDAQVSLGDCYTHGEGTPVDPVKAASWYSRAAHHGHTDAQHNLAVCYARGHGVPQDREAAARWYRRAAEQGCADAQCSLGICLSRGEGVARNPEEAVRWFRLAAEQGHRRAQRELGIHLANGEGAAQDWVEAVGWYRRAADQGDAEAQDRLGRCYASGQGVTKDAKEAAKWRGKAAEQGDAEHDPAPRH